MSKKNFLSGRDRELVELSEQFEAAMAAGTSFYADADDLADLADWYATHHKYDEAKQAARYGLYLHPDNAALLIELTYIHFDLMEMNEAREIAARIDKDDYSPEATILRANLLADEGKMEEAELLLDTIEEKDELHNIIDIAYMYLDANCPEKAWEWLEPGLNLYAEEESFMATLGDYYFAIRQIDQSLYYFNSLIDRNPYSPHYWLGVARCHYDRQEYEKVIEACDYAIISDEEFAEAHTIKGNAFYELGNDEAALECFRRVDKLGALPKGFLDAFVGINLVTKLDWKKALPHLERAIEQFDSTRGSDYITMAGLYSNTALCLHYTGNSEKAHIYCRKAREMAPSEPDSYLIEGRIYIEEGKDKEGLSLWRNAVELNPMPLTWHDIANHCIDMGHFVYAKYALEQVHTLDPDFEGISEWIAALSLVLKDKEGFLKFNRLCKYPMTEIDIKRLEEILNETDELKQAELLKALLRPYNNPTTEF